MIKQCFFFVVFMVGATFSYSQNNDNGYIPGVGMGGNLQPNDNLNALSVRKEVIPMEHFLDTDWFLGDLYYDGEFKLKARPVKLDILNTYVVVKENNASEKVLPFSRLDSAFVSQEDGTKRKFVTKIPQSDGKLALDGFFEVVVNTNNPHIVVIQYDAEVVEPNVKAAMNASRKEVTSRLNTNYFIIYKNHLYPVVRSKKKFVKQFNPSDQAKLSQSLKTLKTNLKERSDIVLFVQSLD